MVAPILFHAHHEDSPRDRIHGDAAGPLSHRNRKEALARPAIKGCEGPFPLVADKDTMQGGIGRDSMGLPPYGDPEALLEVPRIEGRNESVPLIRGVETA